MKKFFFFISILLFILSLYHPVFAQTNCPSDPQNYSNQDLIDRCTLGELAQLSNERLITFPSHILTQISNNRLQDFSNDQLVIIGQATGDLPGFLNRFSNDRLLKPQLPNHILSQLPQSRIKTFPCHIQEQLGSPCPTPTRSPSPSPSLIPSPPLPATSAPTQPSPTKTVISITINDQNLDPKGSELKFSLPIADPTKESDAPVKITVTYSDGTTKDFFLTFHYKPKQQPTNKNEFLVDVIIHKSLTNYDEVANWAKDTVNNYINTRFTEASITKRLKVDNVITNYDEKNGCLPGGARKEYASEADVTCQYYDGKIRLWFYKQGAGGNLPATSAGPPTAQVWQSLPGVESGIKIGERDYWGKDQFADQLMHEIGHLFTIPDYYFEDVPAAHNEVVPLEITAYVQDIMWSQVKYSNFSTTSAGFVNRVTTLPAGFGTPPWEVQYTPGQTILKITDDNKTPLSNIKIEVFQQDIEVRNGVIVGTIPNKIKFQGFTNNDGEFNLGDYDNMFGIPKRFDSGNSIFLRINNGDQIRYMAITRSYLNTLYFQGQTNTAIISLPFSSLIIYEAGKTKTLSAPGQISPQPLSDQERRLLEKHIKQDLPTPQPIPSPTPISLTPIRKLYDLTDDGAVNVFDASKFIQLWQSGRCTTQIDFDKNQVCNSLDYAKLKSSF